MRKIFIIFLTVMFFAVSCRKEDETSQRQEIADYEIVPFSITVDIEPMADDVNAKDLKNTFTEGDVIEISNSKILVEPAVLTSEGGSGKDKAVFSGELKVKYNATLTLGTTKFTAVLKNGKLYNEGRPYVDVKSVSSLKEGLEKYGYWACENFVYNNDASINLEQKTIFVEFNLPVGGAEVSMVLGRAYSNKILSKHEILAIPFGTELISDLLQINKKLDEDGKKVYKINVSLPENCVPGLFSVGYNKKVFFSNGNLQYRPNDGAWRIAPYQYHRCFVFNETEVGENYKFWSGENAWTDLLGWGTWIEGGSPELTSSNIVYYNYPVNENGVLIGKCAFEPEKWSVLGSAEWYYLLNDRTDAKLKKGLAKIVDVEGLVLLPDDWAMPEGLPDFQNEGGNEYTSEEWSKMEAAGAVFLPAEGYRRGMKIELNNWGAYWSPDVADDGKATAWVMEFSPNNMFESIYSESLYLGFSVRLVCGVQDVMFENPENPEDPEKPASNEDRCLVVESVDNAANYWDSQFWIIPENEFKAGQEFEISMSVKADYEAASLELEIHDNSGTRVDGLADGNPSLLFTPEWKEVNLSGKFKSDGKSIVFNLSHDDRANKYYFDNISLKIDGVETIVNGDCQTDENGSFLKKDGGTNSFSFVNFIEKSSIMPAKPREDRAKEPGLIIFAKDFTQLTEYPYYHNEDEDGNMICPELSSEDGFISHPRYKKDGSLMWYQFFVATDIRTEIGKKYSIKVEIKGDEAGSFEAEMRWSWTEDPIFTTVEYSTEWETREFFFDEPIGGNSRGFIIFRPGELPYTIYVRNLTVIYQGE